jgi:glutamate dehydrogenase/leucine dehydrogenase
MSRSFAEVVSDAETNRVTNRTAAYMLAIERVARALTLRGFYA